MSALRERGSVVPDFVLSDEVKIRLERFKTVYQVGAVFGIDCTREAEVLADRLLFARWWAGKVER